MSPYIYGIYRLYKKALYTATHRTYGQYDFMISGGHVIDINTVHVSLGHNLKILHYARIISCSG